MTREDTIDWKGGSRRVELQDPGSLQRKHKIATAPTPLALDQETVEWIRDVCEMGSEVSESQIDSISLSDSLDLLGSVLGYWGDLSEGNIGGDSEKGGETPPDSFDFNANGSVDLEDMR